VLAELYVDETNTHEGPEFICVAGYLFLRRKAKCFSWRLKRKLKKHSVPYFHMKECNPCKGIFDHLEMEQCDEIARKVISLTKAYSEIGFAVALHKEAYRSALTSEFLNTELGNEYSFCLREILGMTRRWVERTGFTGDISYFFESGAKHQSEADKILTNMFESERTGKNYNYSAHSFVNKRKFMPLASADMLAWHYQKRLKQDPGNSPRRDLLELLRPHDQAMHLDKNAVTEMFNRLRSERPHFFEE
jgi:hypothetical protein